MGEMRTVRLAVMLYQFLTTICTIFDIRDVCGEIWQRSDNQHACLKHQKLLTGLAPGARQRVHVTKNVEALLTE